MHHLPVQRGGSWSRQERRGAHPYASALPASSVCSTDEDHLSRWAPVTAGEIARRWRGCQSLGLWSTGRQRALCSRLQRGRKDESIERWPFRGESLLLRCRVLWEQEPCTLGEGFF